MEKATVLMQTIYQVNSHIIRFTVIQAITTALAVRYPNEMSSLVTAPTGSYVYLYIHLYVCIFIIINDNCSILLRQTQ